MRKLEKTLLEVNSLASGTDSNLSALSILIVTLLYIGFMLSVPLYAPQKVILFAIYPVVQSEMSGLGYGKVFLKSLWVLPLILFIGIFNPFLDREVAFSIAGINISRGWVSFLSLTLRGLFAVQAAYILARTAGFFDMCHSLRHLGCPKILIVQLQFTFRYICVIVEEAMWMDRARAARGFGRKNYPLSMWGRFVGQLLIRSYDRATAIHRVMLARGFNGSIPAARSHKMNRASIIFMIIWSALFVALRLFNFESVFSGTFQPH
ncbi:MAG: cobalt ECF transporter T component CbiQ [Bacteroides sp.]|nr:cobalt ECF transporter T component CbiQ [Bacteroides sp.]MBD5348797.1 cobalt ECF transporter T component CbiQ [Bacteroides sp.]